MTPEEHLEYLKAKRERVARECNAWSDSGDRGACFHSEVRPLDEEIAEMEKDNCMEIVFLS